MKYNNNPAVFRSIGFYISCLPGHKIHLDTPGRYSIWVLVLKMKESHDEKTGYCRSLGHHVPFKYCRTVNNDLPCRKIKDCWFESMDIDQFLNEQYTDSERELIFAPYQEKISTIIDLINRARGNK